MNHDEFAFLNQQLAAMLREGIPLEGALRKLCQEARRGEHRTALVKLQAELERGTPLQEAISKSELPEFYCEMIRIGAVSGDLPGVLTLAADYYRRVGSIWTRLRALLTYPFLVMLVSLLISIWFAFLYRHMHATLAAEFSAPPQLNVFQAPSFREMTQAHWWLNLWIPPVAMMTAVIAWICVLSAPGVRARLRWRVAPFKDASLAQLAAALHLLVKQGVPLREALTFAARLEPANRAAKDIRLWAERHAQGRSRFTDLAEGSVAVPSLFIWIVSSAGEDMAAGFAQAAELYGERARRRAEILLNMVLPCMLLALGLMIMGQIQPFVTSVFDIFTPIFKASQIIRAP